MLIALIPAYNPVENFPEYIEQLIDSSMFHHILVVNDGSAVQYGAIFKSVMRFKSVTVLSHTVNQGKGAALKTGFIEVISRFPGAAGVVTMDADGQHAVKDVCHVAEILRMHPNQLILGGRHFDHDTPARSAFGNFLTRHVFKWVTQVKLFDTQSGLRGIPFGLMRRILAIKSNGYEFEVEMLIQAPRSGFGFRRF